MYFVPPLGSGGEKAKWKGATKTLFMLICFCAVTRKNNLNLTKTNKKSNCFLITISSVMIQNYAILNWWIMKWSEPFLKSQKDGTFAFVCLFYFMLMFSSTGFDIKIWLDDCLAARLCFGNSTNVKLAENLEKSVIFDSLPGIFSPGRELAQ